MKVYTYVKRSCLICGSGAWHGPYPARGEMHCSKCKMWAQKTLALLIDQLHGANWLRYVGGRVTIEVL